MSRYVPMSCSFQGMLTKVIEQLIAFEEIGNRQCF